MKFGIGLVIGLLVLTLLGISNTEASTVYYDRTAFNAAAGTITTYDFESDTVETIRGPSVSYDSNGWQNFGDFTIEARSGYVYLVEVRQLQGPNGNKDVYINSRNDSAWMNVVFSEDITAFGFNWIAEGNDGYDQSTFALSGTTYTLGTPGDSGFFGVVADVGQIFSAGTLFSFGQISSDWSGMSIDNITYSSTASVPVPGSMLLLGTGLLGLAGVSRRKK